MNFASVLAGSEGLPDGLRVTVPESWHQGRTTYGGFSAALALEAARRVGGTDLPALRSALVSFIGPVSGTVEVFARVQRRGRNAIWIASEIARDGATVCTASFVFMAPVASTLALRDVPLPAGLMPLADGEPLEPGPLAPAFMRNHFELRRATPRNPVAQPAICRWVRLREPQGLDPDTALLLLGDALPPGVLPLLSPATPVSSMTWQANLLSAPASGEDDWFLLRSTGDYARNGCTSQEMRIWNAAGEPVMSGMQSIAIFG